MRRMKVKPDELFNVLTRATIEVHQYLSEVSLIRELENSPKN